MSLITLIAIGLGVGLLLGILLIVSFPNGIRHP
jgi:hypothetical protein